MNEFCKVIRNHAAFSSAWDEGGTPPRRTSVLAPIRCAQRYAASPSLHPSSISDKSDWGGTMPAHPPNGFLHHLPRTLK